MEFMIDKIEELLDLVPLTSSTRYFHVILVIAAQGPHTGRLLVGTALIVSGLRMVINVNGPVRAIHRFCPRRFRRLVLFRPSVLHNGQL